MTKLVPVFLLLTVLPATVPAASFQAGQGGSQKAAQSGANAGGTESPSDLSDERILERLWSPKSFEASAALKALSPKLPGLVTEGKMTPSAMDRVISLLTDESPGVRSAAETLIRDHGELLFSAKLLTEDKLQAYSDAANESAAALARFVALMNALLPERGVNHMKPEYVFQAMDTLDAPDGTASAMAVKMLAREGPNLIANGAWKIEHTQNYLMKFKEADAETRKVMLPILKSNLNDWVNNVFITKADFTSLIESVFAGKDTDLTQQVLDYMSDSKTAVTLNKLQIFDRAWAESLMADIRGADNVRKQAALNLLTNLMRPFALGKTFTGTDFRSVWQTVSADLEAYDAPFDLVSKNLNPLIKAGWFSQSDYGALLKGFNQRPLSEQKEILKFVDSSYSAFNERGWITATPLLPVLFGETTSGELERLRVRFLVEHSDLITEKRLLGREELPEFLKLLHHKDGSVRKNAISIADQGFDEWATQGIVTQDTLRSLVETEPADFRSADVIRLLDKHFAPLMPLFTKSMVEHLGEFAFSPNDKVTDALKEFFSHNIELMKKKGLFTAKVRSNLQKSGLWDEMPKKVKKRAGSSRTKLR
jgi:hypothetical protein